MPYESAPPLVLITAFVTLAGVLQGGIYRTAYGKPKPVGFDSWDRAMARRDEKIAAVVRVRLWWSLNVLSFARFTSAQRRPKCFASLRRSNNNNQYVDTGRGAACLRACFRGTAPAGARA